MLCLVKSCGLQELIGAPGETLAFMGGDILRFVAIYQLHIADTVYEIIGDIDFLISPPQPVSSRADKIRADSFFIGWTSSGFFFRIAFLDSFFCDLVTGAWGWMKKPRTGHAELVRTLTETTRIHSLRMQKL